MKTFTFEQPKNNPTNFYWFQSAFSREELDKIYNELQDVPFQRASVIRESGDDAGSDPIRRSNIKWIPYDDPKWSWLYLKLMDLAEIANNEMWGFDLETAPEMIQYTEYDATELGHYGWHQDIGPGNPSLRKISITVQLSEADEYENGDLEIWQGGELEEAAIGPRGAGNVIIFPSYMPHRVSPVTRGIRRSFVLWLGGSHYK